MRVFWEERKECNRREEGPRIGDDDRFMVVAIEEEEESRESSKKQSRLTSNY